jgi:protoheme IX farnesyltransferase
MVTTALTSTRVFRDYLSLTKPRAILPHFVTAAAAMFLAVGGIPPMDTLILTLTGGGLVAAASNTLNCYFDRELDGRMARTGGRPLPSGRLSPSQALSFGIIAGLVGLLVLSQFVGKITAVLAAAALVYYVLAYTLWLKRHTRWSTLFASGVGAITPLIGWSAVTGNIRPAPFLLAAIVLLWTPPHFWSFAIYHRRDYEQAGLRVLPGRASAWIVVFAFLLVSATLFLAPTAGLGSVYLISVILLGSVFLYLAVRLLLGGAARAQYLYIFSVFYIALIFGAMMIDRLVF